VLPRCYQNTPYQEHLGRHPVSSDRFGLFCLDRFGYPVRGLDQFVISGSNVQLDGGVLPNVLLIRVAWGELPAGRAMSRLRRAGRGSSRAGVARRAHHAGEKEAEVS